MSTGTLESALDFMRSVAVESSPTKVKVTFHGGEPLVAGHAYWQLALEGLARRFGETGFEASVQSNLWLLDDEFCRLFRLHRVEVGTSLDGPEVVTDSQRGKGYFARTMAGVRRAQESGLRVGCIATFTVQSAEHWQRVFDFFIRERLGFSIHATVPGIGCPPSSFVLPPADHADLLRKVLDYYVEHRRELSVSSLDQMCKGVAAGEGKVCTFRDCLGMFLAIAPDGGIYPCQRFCGQPAYRLGVLQDKPVLEDLLTSTVALEFAARERAVWQTCADCAHVDYCKGGCPYNAWASGNDDKLRDPYCPAYRATFDHIQQRLANEMASEKNINAIAERPFAGTGSPLLRKGPLIELAREGPHPSQVARTAKRIIAAVELTRGPDPQTVAARLVKMGISRSQESADISLQGLLERLHPGTTKLNNLYPHVTYACQLNCNHCYARADASGRDQPEMRVTQLEKLIREAKAVGFRQVVVTGGEPLVHTERRAMLDMLAAIRAWTAPMNLVLRTNLAMSLDNAELVMVARGFDQVVVSIDGSQETHDQRRGKGAYQAAVANMERYVELTRTAPSAGELSIATVMRSGEIQGEPGFAVRELARRLGVKRTRFRPLLPLGRARDWDEPPTSEALGAHADPTELIENGFLPVASCGLGQNLYVEPSGESFPCYAYHGPQSHLGNVIKAGLESVLASEGFRDLARHCVDTNAKCRSCEVRYLCGGACRAWGGEATQHDLDAAPPECKGLRARAIGLLAAAQESLGIDQEECHV